MELGKLSVPILLTAFQKRKIFEFYVIICQIRNFFRLCLPQPIYFSTIITCYKFNSI